MQIDQLEVIELGDTRQWIRVRGTDVSNPVLLVMQLGPGLPLINEARSWDRLFGLEEAFTVVYWDQRGTGLTLRKQSHASDLTVAHMVADAISLLELLQARFGVDVFVVGFSFGATFATYAALERPDLVASLVAVGMDVDLRAAEANAYEFALRVARERRITRAIRQLEAIGPPPHLDLKEFNTRVRWVADFGGVTTNTSYHRIARSLLASLVRSPDYSTADVLRTLRGVRSTQAALLPQLAATDLVQAVPRLEVPLVMVQGRLDEVAPADAAQQFHDAVAAPEKQLVWFDESAHTPHLDEPDRFRDVLMEVRASTSRGGRRVEVREGAQRGDPFVEQQ